MLIKIDAREHELNIAIKSLIENNPLFKELKIATEVLPLGDIILSNEENKEDKLIIERKCLSDLYSSIKDGRYEEQSFRLNGSAFHNHNVIYLIEGDMNKISFRIDKPTLYSAVFSLNYYKGFSVLRSLSVNESAFIICNMCNKMKKEDGRIPFYQNRREISLNQNELDSEKIITEINQDLQEEMLNLNHKEDYSSVVKMVKKDNITCDNIGTIMLSQIPGVSHNTAITIMKEYKTLPNLILKMKEGEKLDTLSYLNAKNQKRKINKTAISNLRKYLFADDVNTNTVNESDNIPLPKIL
jgi:ERCC4-type nuclease